MKKSHLHSFLRQLPLAHAGAKSASIGLRQLLLADVSLYAEQDQLIIDYCASPSDNLISLSYSMPAFSENSFGLFLINIFHYLHQGSLHVWQLQ